MLCVGELTTDKTTGNYTYWVFDVVMFDGVNLIDVSFKGRLNYLPKVVLRLQKIFSVAKSPINVVPKVFHDLSALKEPPQTDLENDGFILYNREKNYKHPIFKMNNGNQNTCDLLVYNKEGVLWFCGFVLP